MSQGVAGKLQIEGGDSVRANFSTSAVRQCRRRSVPSALPYMPLRWSSAGTTGLDY